MNRRKAIGALAVAGIFGGGWMLTQSGARNGLGSTPLPGAAFAQDAASDVELVDIPDMVLGAADAPVEIIEYASYTCPHCAAFHSDQFQQIKENYIDTGKVRFIFREVYFDRFGLWASMIARCGGEERFYGINDLLFESQRDWIAGGQDPSAIADNLRRIGITAGMEPATVEACLSDGAQAQSLVAWFQENADRDEINSTPTFMVDGTKYANMSYADFSALIEERLAAQ